MKTFKRRNPRPGGEFDALCFALNENLNDLRMLAELRIEMASPDWKTQPTYSTEQLMDELRKSYIGHFRTKRLRKKHADLVMPRTKEYLSLEKLDVCSSPFNAFEPCFQSKLV